MQRRGLQYSLSFLIVLVLAVFFAGGSLGFADAFRQLLGAGFTDADIKRTAQTIEMLEFQAQGVVKMEYSGDYDIEVASQQGNVLFMRSQYAEDRKTIRTSPQYDWQFEGGNQEITTDSLCIIKRGVTYRLQTPPCDVDPCQPGVCSPRIHPTFDTEDWSQGLDDVARFGYWCKGGAFTRDGFYEQYRSSGADSCDPITGDFAEINTASCPTRVIEGQEVTCSAEVTYRCPEDESVSISIEGQSQIGIGGGQVPDGAQDRQLACDGEIQHREIALNLGTIQQPSGLFGGLQSEWKQYELKLIASAGSENPDHTLILPEIEVQRRD